MKYFMEYCFVDRHSNFYALIVSRQQENIEIFIIVVNIDNINVWDAKKVFFVALQSDSTSSDRWRCFKNVEHKIHLEY